jgi:hypothetical protein
MNEPDARPRVFSFSPYRLIFQLSQPSRRRAGKCWTIRHDFERRPFAGSGLPLLRELPFTLALNGGVFWTDLVGQTRLPGDSLLVTAPTPYREVGLSVGNLTPFLAPFNLAAEFSWQLSSYPTRRFRFGLGLTDRW